MEPNEPTNYQALGKLYEDAGRYDEAEAHVPQGHRGQAERPAVYEALAGYYNRQGHFEKTMDALEKRADIEPNNPEAWHTMATVLPGRGFRDKTPHQGQASDYVTRAWPPRTRRWRSIPSTSRR